VYAVTKADRDELARHLQRFLLVLLPDGHKWFFRYYDPRILQAYLPACEPAELQEFFGPVRAFATVDIREERAFLLENVRAPGEETPALNSHAGGLWPIRPNQFHALNRASGDRFVKQAAAHICEFFPAECSRMSQSEIEQYVRHGVGRAGSYGIHAEQHVCQYLDLIFAFGPNFDQEHCWAAEVLADRSTGLSSEKLQRLYEAAKRFEAEKGAVRV